MATGENRERTTFGSCGFASVRERWTRIRFLVRHKVLTPHQQWPYLLGDDERESRQVRDTGRAAR
jgi:hypothetical protein